MVCPYACDVLVGFSPVGCTLIQIAATLGYEYHLFVTVINALMTLLYFNYLSDNSCLA
jgi:hypothetical protein